MLNGLICAKEAHVKPTAYLKSSEIKSVKLILMVVSNVRHLESYHNGDETWFSFTLKEEPRRKMFSRMLILNK